MNETGTTATKPIQVSGGISLTGFSNTLYLNLYQWYIEVTAEKADKFFITNETIEEDWKVITQAVFEELPILYRGLAEGMRLTITDVALPDSKNIQALIGYREILVSAIVSAYENLYNICISVDAKLKFVRKIWKKLAIVDFVNLAPLIGENLFLTFIKYEKNGEIVNWYSFDTEDVMFIMLGARNTEQHCQIEIGDPKIREILEENEERTTQNLTALLSERMEDVYQTYHHPFLLSETDLDQICNILRERVYTIAQFRDDMSLRLCSVRNRPNPTRDYYPMDECFSFVGFGKCNAGICISPVIMQVSRQEILYGMYDYKQIVYKPEKMRTRQ